MKLIYLKSPRRVWLAASLVTTLTSVSVTADIHTWSGNGRDALWSNPANWTTSPPDSRDANLQIVFPAHTRASQRPINDIPGLRVTILTLSGSNYELDAQSAAHGLTIAAGATITSSGTNNSIAASLGLSVNNGIANVAVAGGAVFRVHCAIAGPGSITKSGAGTWWIEGATPNTFAQLYVTGGLAGLNKPPGVNAVGVGVEIHRGSILRLNVPNQIPDTGEVVMVASSLAALPVFDLNRHDETVAAVSGTGVIELGDAITFPLPLGSARLTIDQPVGTARVFSGPIHGVNGEIHKLGQGVLSFNYSPLPGAGAPSTYSGTTFVDAGEVYFNRAAPNTLVLVSGSARVGGTRTPGVAGAPAPAVKGIALSLGYFSPGAHLLGVDAPLASTSLGMRSSARFVARLVSPTVYHRANVSGPVYLEQPVLELTADFQPTTGASFTLIDNGGTDAVLGTFAALPEGAAIEANGLKYRVSYIGGDGNDVTLTRVGQVTVAAASALTPLFQPVSEGGSNAMQLRSLSRAAARFNVEASEDLGNPLGWHWMGEAVADDFGVLRFSDPDVAQSQRFYRFAPSVMSPVVDPLPAARFMPVSSLAPETLAAVQQHLIDFGPAPGAPPGTDAEEWSNVAIAPTAALVFDPLHQDGNEPAYAELKIVPAGQPNGPAKGYVLVSLLDDDSPIVEFGTRGATKTERILRRVPHGAPDKILRFSSAFWSVEDAAGQKLAEYGTPPSALLGPPTGTNTSGQLEFDAANGRWSVTPRPPLEYAPTFDYRSMKQNFISNSTVANFRLARSLISSPLWGRLRGGRLTRFTLAERQTSVFLENTPLLRARLDIDSDQMPIAEVRLRAAGGFAATGVRAGSGIVRVVTAAGQPQAYTLVVTRSALNAAPVELTAAGCPNVDVDTWYAGTGWDGDQRIYQQFQDDDDWCPAVGCGPTALAMLLGWWDANGVPSAFYKLNSGRGNATHFRFNFDSLATSDAPKWDVNSESLVRAVYQDLHELCNTFCVSGQGATAPDQLASAFAEYVFRVAAAWPTPQGEFGQFLVGCIPEASWNDFFLLGGTDWEGGGKAVAEGIKHGRPGIVGIWSGISPHYALAYGYRRVEKYDGCEMVELRRWFKCNMGWGSDDPPEWHDAEAVWFGLTANMWQNSPPQKPQNYARPPLQVDVFNEDLDPARCAAVMDDAGNRIDLLFAVNRVLPSSLERIHSPDGANTWYYGIDAALNSGLFRSSPAATVSTAGSTIDLFGRGMDKKIWRSRSLDGGTSFGGWAPLTHSGGSGAIEVASAPAVAGSANAQMLHLVARHDDGRFMFTRLVPGFVNWSTWVSIGSGLFSSAPAIACSGDGQKVFAFGRGTDNGIWWNYSLNAGTNWLGWAPIVEGAVFSSAPAAAASADGNTVHIVARGMDNRYYSAIIVSLGGPYVVGQWKPIGEGVFSSGPAVVCTSDGAKVHVFGRGWPPPPPPQGSLPDPNLPRFWRAYSGNAGASWQLAWDDLEPGLE